MSIKPADIFCASCDVDEFKAKLVAADGDFTFEPDDMIELGTEYFKRYPDSFSDRNLPHVHMGYQITRACISEKMLAGIPAAHRPVLRTALDNISVIEETLHRLNAEIGTESLLSYHGVISRNLEEVRKNIDELPKGMIKERFVGGITKFYNVLYLLKSGIERIGSAAP